MIQKKVNISKQEFEEMMRLAETNPTMLDALERTKMVYELLQTPEQIKNKEAAREVIPPYYCKI